jgi:hypothetical protein
MKANSIKFGLGLFVLLGAACAEPSRARSAASDANAASWSTCAAGVDPDDLAAEADRVDAALDAALAPLAPATPPDELETQTAPPRGGPDPGDFDTTAVEALREQLAAIERKRARLMAANLALDAELEETLADLEVQVARLNFACRKKIGCGLLATGRRLARGQALESCDGSTILAMQGTDGNLVVYVRKSGRLEPRWDSFTRGAAPGDYFVMQGDGNAVLYRYAEKPNDPDVALWWSNTRDTSLVTPTLEVASGGFHLFEAGRPSAPLFDTRTAAIDFDTKVSDATLRALMDDRLVQLVFAPLAGQSRALTVDDLTPLGGATLIRYLPRSEDPRSVGLNTTLGDLVRIERRGLAIVKNDGGARPR